MIDNKKNIKQEQKENDLLSFFKFDPPAAKQSFFENDDINDIEDFMMAKWCGYIK